MSRSTLPLPRNAKVLDGLEKGSSVVVSFVGDTDYKHPHVYADPGRDYNWRFAEHVRTVIVVRPGLDVLRALVAIFEAEARSGWYPTLVDIEAKTVGSIVDGQPIKLWPKREGCETW